MKLVLLDRDGVINIDRPDSVKSKEEFILLPHVIEAIHLLNKAAIPVVVATNQAVVGRGMLSEEGLDDIHLHMNQILHKQSAHIERIYKCTSVDPNHPDRKPNPGLLLKAFQDFQVTPKEAVFIGDALRDLEAAHYAGCHKVLVRTGKGQHTLEEGIPEGLLPVSVFDDLMGAIKSLLHEQQC